ncbi:MAG: hypothetical protein GY926_19405 [bacterium]|nr:hypothetical protein [bacterium]
MQIVKIQEVSFTIASGASSGTGSLSGFTTLGKMVAFASWRVADGQSPALASNTDVDVYVSSTSQITAERWGTPSYEITIRAYVIEFSSDTTVQKGTWAMTDSETSDTASISSSTLANSFAWHYRKSEGEATPSNDSDPDGRLTRFLFNSTTELGVGRTIAKGACEGHWFVVSSSTLSVQHIQNSVTAQTGTSITDAITSVTTANTFLVGSMDTDEAVYNDEGVWVTDLQNATTLRWRRSYSSAVDSIFDVMVVEDSALTVQRGEWSVSGTSTNTAITIVDTDLAVAKHADGTSGRASTSDYNNGNMDGRYWELWFGTSSQINGQTGDGLADLIATWEVVEFESESNIKAGDGVSAGVATVTGISGNVALSTVALGSLPTQEPARPNSTSVNVTGVNFGASQGTTEVWLTNDPVWGDETVKTEQTSIDSWTDSSFGFDVALGSLSQGTSNLFVVKDPGGTPQVSNSLAMLISSSDVHYESDMVAIPTGTGVKTLFTPTISDVKAYIIWWDGSVADDTTETDATWGVAVVTDDEAIGAVCAATDGANSDVREQIRQSTDGGGALSIFADAADTTSEVRGTLTIGSSGQLQSNLSLNDDAGYNLHVLAIGGRTAKAYIGSSTISAGEIGSIPFPSNPDLAVVLGVGVTFGSSSTAGLHNFGVFDGSSSWWIATHFSSIATAESRLRSSAIGGQLSGGSLTYEMTSPAFAADAPNRKITWSGSNADEIGMLFLWVDAESVDVGTFTKETTGGDPVTQALPTMGFDPTGAVMLATANKTSETVDGTGDVQISLGIKQGDSQQTSANVTIVNNAGTDFIARKRSSTSLAIETADDLAGGVDIGGDLQELTDQVDVDWSPNTTAATIFGYIGLSESVGVAAGDGSAAGAATTTGIGGAIKGAAGSAAGTATTAGVGQSTIAAVATSAGVATVAGVGQAAAAGAGSSAGLATVAGVGQAIAAGVGSSSGAAPATGVGGATAGAVGSAAGSATTSGIGAGLKAAVVSAAGVGTTSGVGGATAGVAGSATGVAVVSGVGVATAAGVASSVGAATVSGVGQGVTASSASVTGVATVAGVGQATTAAIASAAGSATTTGIGQAAVAGVGTSAGSATTSGVGQAATQAVAASAGAAIVAGVGLGVRPGVASAAGVATVTGASSAVAEGTGSATGTATATGVGQDIPQGVASAAGAATSTGIGQATTGAVASAAGVAVVSGVGTTASEGVGSAAGMAVAAGVGQATTGTVGASVGAAVVSGVGQAQAAGTASAAGAATVAGVGIPVIPGVGSAAGAATSTAIAQGIGQGVGSAAGAAVAAGVGQGTTASIASASGAATVSGIGQGSGIAVGSAVGSAVVTGVGQATKQAVFSAAGAATVSGVGQDADLEGGDANAAGTSTAAAVGVRIFPGVGSSAGVATVLGIATAATAGVGSSAGVSAVSGVGTPVVPGVGSSAGAAVVSGVGQPVGQGVASAAGAATTVGVGAGATAAVASAVGAATVSGIGQGTGQGVGGSAGAATATGVGAGVVPAVASSAGSATTAGAGEAAGGSVATAAGSATVSGVGQGTTAAVASAAGAATVSGISIVATSGVGSSAGVATVTGVGLPVLPGTASAAGTATSAAAGLEVRQGVANSAGTATATAISAATAQSVAMAAGLALTLGVGTAIAQAAANAAGTSFVQASSQGEVSPPYQAAVLDDSVFGAAVLEDVVFQVLVNEAPVFGAIANVD